MIGLTANELVVSGLTWNGSLLRVPQRGCNAVEVFLRNVALALFDSKDPVNSRTGNFVDRAAWPVHLNQIDLRRLLDSEMQPQIALRKITVATVHFVNLC